MKELTVKQIITQITFVYLPSNNLPIRL